MTEGGAVVFIDREGRYVDASDEALRLLGVTLPELLEMSPTDFTRPGDPPDEVAGKVEQVQAGDPALGEATLVRPDGKQTRISFSIIPEADRFRVEFRPTAAPVDRPMEFRTLADLLVAWREAERRLGTQVEGSAEWSRLRKDVESLRAEYQRLFNSRQRRSGTT